MMHILLELDLALYLILFSVAGITGLVVRIDRWVDGIQHPKKENNQLDLLRTFWSYVLIFVLSGMAGLFVSVGMSYFLKSPDMNIMLFTASTIGAIGKLIFYKLVEWVHMKFDDNVKDGGSAFSGRKRRQR